MQPYQKASAAQMRQAEEPGKVLGKAASIGSSALATGLGAGVASRVLPFLSKYIPQDLFMKGISKISPGLGNFVSNALESGQDLEQVKDFIGKKYESSQEPAKEIRNIIEQYSPELYQFIDQEVKQGRSPIEAGAIAQNDKRFGSSIQKMTKDHKAPWSAILESVFGSSQQAQPQQQPQQGQQQVGSGQEKLMSILQKIQQARGQQ